MNHPFYVKGRGFVAVGKFQWMIRFECIGGKWLIRKEKLYDDRIYAY